MSTTESKAILVTGGNAGIGFALCRQLAVENKCHVFMGSRNAIRGKAAVAKILEKAPKAKVELLVLDVGSDESVKAAAKKLTDQKVCLYGLVNNAGAGLSHGVTSKTILNVNLQGPKRVFEAFFPLLDTKCGRVCNVSSGLASGYMKMEFNKKPLGKASAEVRAPMKSFDVTWKDIMACVAAEEKAYGGDIDGLAAYGLSKAGLTAYTMLLAKKHPNLISASCSPGFIATGMTKGYGAKLTPEQGTVSLKHCLFNVTKSQNGFYFGSDGKRSPLDKSREPGEPEYTGE